MPCWYYEKEDLEHTPSIKDGIDPGTEARYRREGSRFIIEAGTTQKLRYDTMATGVVYFHRFYMFHSFKEFPRYIMGAACLFLAGKVEETPKKCKDIIKIAKNILSEQHFAAFGDDPKEEIMTHERILLQTIKFDLQVEHPYSYLLKYAKTFKGDKDKIQKLVQMAWTFVNDSLCTRLCLQWEPHIVAVGFLYLAGRLSKSDLMDWSGKSTKTKWWEQLTEDVSLDIMEEICHKLLDLYAAGQHKAPTSQGTPTKVPPKRPKPKSAQDGGHGDPKAKMIKQEHSREKQRHPPPPPSSGGTAPPAHSSKAIAMHDRRQASPAPPPPPRVHTSGYPSNASTHQPHPGSSAQPPPPQPPPQQQAPPHQAPPLQVPPHQAPQQQAPPPQAPQVPRQAPQVPRQAPQVPRQAPQVPRQVPQVPHQVPHPATHIVTHPVPTPVPHIAPPHQPLPTQHHQPPVIHHQPPQPTLQTAAPQVPPPPATVTHPNLYQQVPAYTHPNPPVSTFAAPQYSTPHYSTGSVQPPTLPPATQTQPVIPPSAPAPAPVSSSGHLPPSQPPYQIPGQFMNHPPPPAMPHSYNRPPPATIPAQQYQQPPPVQSAVPQQPPIYRPPPPRPAIPGMPQTTASMPPQFPPRQLPPGQLPPNQAPPSLPNHYQPPTPPIPTPTTQYRSHTPPVSHPVAQSQYSFSRSQSEETTPFPAVPSTATSAAPPPPGIVPNYPPPNSSQPAPGQPPQDKSMLSIAQEYAAQQLQSMGVPRNVAMQPVTGFVGQQQQQGTTNQPPGTVGQQPQQQQQQQQQGSYSTGLATVRITGREMMGRRPSHGSAGGTYR